MARAAKLKVFRMAVGFHDAYVAAPSQKQAAEAWGADTDVFRRGDAEVVTAPELTKEPLANPGKVVKRLRGTAAEQIAALGESEDGPGVRPVPRSKEGKTKPAPKPKPRPSRARVDEAEAALAEAVAQHEAALAEIAARETELARRRKALEAKQAAERERLEARQDKARNAYEDALKKWRAS